MLLRNKNLTKRKKKYSLTLLEITVAFFLVGVLLSSLWGIYYSYLVTHQKNQKIQAEAYKLLFLKERLDKIASLVASSPSKEEKNTVFTPQEKVEGIQTVCFSYHNAPDPDPAFNGRVCSLLYMNSIKQLCLATWSTEKTPRIDILLQGTTSFSLNFFDPQINLWRNDWPDTIKHIPLWMRLNIDGQEKLELLFRLDHCLDPILYLED